MSGLAGRVAVVTGSSRGIGLKVAETLEREGAHVVRLARSLSAARGKHRTDLPCDVTDAAAVERAAGAINREIGVPDVLVNAAGTFLIRPFAETTARDLADLLATNLTGAFSVLKAFLGPMRERGSGVVVTIGSIADHAAYPGNAAYSAAKFALRGLHNVMAAELAGTGVRASLISPGPVNTAMWDAVDPDSKPGFLARSSMLCPEDVAEAVRFVATRPERVTIPEMLIEPRR